MSTTYLIFIVASAVIILLLLVLKLKISAFISLLIVSIYTGLLSGMSPEGVLNSIQNGMGGTLGFVATVVGLGAIFGQILENSGGALSLAHTLIKKFGEKRAPTAMVLAGFIVAIPVFFDVGFIILVPIIYALARDTKKLAIASGATLLSHVNDSGFWLVGKYLRMNEKQTLQSWTVMETIIAVGGLTTTMIAGLLI